MKKVIVIVLLLFCGAITFAQKSESSLHFGLKAAPSIAWLKTDSKEFTSDGSKFGFAYGLMTEFNFTDHYAFATGIDVAYRGGKLKYVSSIKNVSGGDSIIMSSSSKYNLQFVELPITLKLKTKEIGSLTYFLQFGIAPGINIRAKADQSFTTQTGNVTSSADSTDIDIKDNINNFNLSMIIGGGLEYTLSGETTLLAGIQFSNGFLDVFDASSLKANSNYLALTVGILF